MKVLLILAIAVVQVTFSCVDLKCHGHSILFLLIPTKQFLSVIMSSHPHSMMHSLFRSKAKELAQAMLAWAALVMDGTGWVDQGMVRIIGWEVPVMGETG